MSDRTDGTGSRNGVKEIYIIEAAMFSAGRALSPEELSEATDIGKRKCARLIDKLRLEYHEREGSLEIIPLGGKFAMRLKPAYADYAAKLAQMDVPLKVLKTVALIAYHQPLKQSQLVLMVGSKAYDHVKELHDIGLIRVRRDGTTKVLTTSKRFQEYFGIDAVDRKGIKEWLANKVGIDPETIDETLDDFGEGAPGDRSTGDTDTGGDAAQPQNTTGTTARKKKTPESADTAGEEERQER